MELKTKNKILETTLLLFLIAAILLLSSKQESLFRNITLIGLLCCLNLWILRQIYFHWKKHEHRLYFEVTYSRLFTLAASAIPVFLGIEAIKFTGNQYVGAVYYFLFALFGIQTIITRFLKEK